MLQGQLAPILNSSLPVEPAPLIRRGDVCSIRGGGSVMGDFFISLDQHDDWAPSFTVWGHVTHGMPVVERIVHAAYTQVLHPSGTTMRMLQQPVHIQVVLQ